MMDPLKDAANALRETTSGEEAGAACYTRSRILADLRQKRRRRTINSIFAVPLAAVLVGSVAWAATGEGLPAIVQRVSVALGLREPAKSPQAAAPSARAMVQPTLPPPVAPATVTPTETPIATTTTKSAPLPPRDSPVTEAELSLYETAHRAHFVGRDYDTALLAWQEYLRQVPRGRFATEANYNRALCLLRLGRKNEARVALEPFASGRYGNYRKAEAEALVRKVEEEP